MTLFVAIAPFREYSSVHIQATEGYVVDASKVLKEAWEAVQGANLPEEVHEVAFREAVRLLSPPTTVGGPAAPIRPNGGNGQAPKSDSAGNGIGSTKDSGATGGSGGDITVSEDDLLSKVAAGTGTSQEKLESLVHLDDGVLKLSLPGIKLGKNNADKTRAIAQVLSIVRAFGLDEDGTSVESVRVEAQRLKCYDGPNFTKQLARLTPGYIITGSGSNKRVRAKAGGIASFPALVDQLLGDS